jgi:methyl-accepting chemotaxis protein
MKYDFAAIEKKWQDKWEETAKLVENIQKNGNTIARVLNHLLNQSEEDIRKEVDHD